jgi:hypothetical protein
MNRPGPKMKHELPQHEYDEYVMEAAHDMFYEKQERVSTEYETHLDAFDFPVGNLERQLLAVPDDPEGGENKVFKPWSARLLQVRMGLDKHGWEPTLEVEELVFLLEFRNASTNFDQVHWQPQPLVLTRNLP